MPITTVHSHFRWDKICRGHLASCLFSASSHD